MCKRNFKKNEIFFAFAIQEAVSTIYNMCLCDDGLLLFGFNHQKSV